MFLCEKGGVHSLYSRFTYRGALELAARACSPLSGDNNPWALERDLHMPLACPVNYGNYGSKFQLLCS